jgi:hypothetical protein
MNIKFFFFAGSSLIFATCAFARIGETLDECKSRYGSAGQIAADQFTFQSGQLSIVVHIRNGRPVQEDFAPQSGNVLSEVDFTQLLQENSEGSSWELTGETATYASYLRKDGKATAQKAKPNTTGSGNVKLSMQGAELIIKYTAEAINALSPAPSRRFEPRRLRGFLIYLTPNESVPNIELYKAKR